MCYLKVIFAGIVHWSNKHYIYFGFFESVLGRSCRQKMHLLHILQSESSLRNQLKTGECGACQQIFIPLFPSLQGEYIRLVSIYTNLLGLVFCKHNMPEHWCCFSWVCIIKATQGFTLGAPGKSFYCVKYQYILISNISQQHWVSVGESSGCIHYHAGIWGNAQACLSLNQP